MDLFPLDLDLQEKYTFYEVQKACKIKICSSVIIDAVSLEEKL